MNFEPTGRHATLVVRCSPATKDLLKAVSMKTKLPMAALIDEAVEAIAAKYSVRRHAKRA